MRTNVIHNRLGCYNLCNPAEKSESYVLNFGKDRIVAFTFKEDDAPQLHVNDMHIEDLIDYLAQHKSQRYIFSSGYSHSEEKAHDERIRIAREWAHDNKFDDNEAYIEVLDCKIAKLMKQVKQKQGVRDMLAEECQELLEEAAGAMK